MAALTVGAVIAGLLPNGSRPRGRRSWQQCPIWPPDAFAVAATLAERSGCYAEPGIVLSRMPAEREDKRRNAQTAAKAGKWWARASGKTLVPRAARDAWAALVAAWGDPVCAGPANGVAWKRAAVRLLAIADEACMGVGFLPDANEDDIVRSVFDELVPPASNALGLQLPASLAVLVSPDIACVLPKSLTPEVGCTLRSLSHHLALLPGKGAVQPQWYLSVSRPPGDEPSADENDAPRTHALTLLLIPFPYVVHGTDFVVSKPPAAGVDGYFALRQGWLTDADGTPVLREALADFVGGLIRAAERDCGPVHGLVFPEVALTQNYAIDLAADLAAIFPALEMLVCGTLRQDEQSWRNEAVVIRLERGAVAGVLVQSKHHRWRLDASQIVRYQLGQVLDPCSAWWEHIDVHERKMHFGLNHHESVVAALVCEDLARFDPVMPALMAVGPNLVFALLMDGPQFEGRWSGRYATALAEDPGSSVLTITCLGMVRRWSQPGQDAPRVIALWKSRGEPAVPLTLPNGAHGLVLALTTRENDIRSLDLREESGTAIEYRLGGVRSVVLPSGHSWLERSG
jgi:hypothetical protein